MKNILEEYGAKLIYKPGHQNIVADALSRQLMNVTTSDCSLHSTDSSQRNEIKTVLQPINSLALNTNNERKYN